MVIIKRPAFTKSYVSTYAKFHCTDFHDCPLVRTPCFPIGKDSDAGRDWGQEEKGTTEDEMAGWHH